MRKNFLSQLERQTCITYKIIGSVIVVIIATYVIFTVRLCLSINDVDKSDKIEAQIIWVNTIGLAFLTILPSAVNIVMIHRLRNRFDDLYADYGCKIQTIMIIQVVSILALSTFSLMFNNDSWMDFWN